MSPLPPASCSGRRRALGHRGLAVDHNRPWLDPDAERARVVRDGLSRRQRSPVLRSQLGLSDYAAALGKAENAARSRAGTSAAIFLRSHSRHRKATLNGSEQLLVGRHPS